VGHKRIFLFTNNDNPNEGDIQVRDRSIQVDVHMFKSHLLKRAKDLTELGIDIELFSMNKAGHHFDAKLFYQAILSLLVLTFRI
jgi:ATP-dependent DNA helicase 2 subunit 1